MRSATRWASIGGLLLASGCHLIAGLGDPVLQEGKGGGGSGTTSSTASTGGNAQGGGGSGGGPFCEPGSTIECYEGPAGTKGIGLCKAGKRTCAQDGSEYGACAGEITPAVESCASAEDENCDGYDCVQWAALFGDDTDQHPWRVAVDAMGNTYIVGMFYGAIPLMGNTLIAAGSGDIFLIKLDAAGKHVWSKQFGDNNGQIGYSVAVDATGNVILGGYTASAISFDGGTTQVPPGLFVTKFTGDGQYVWSARLGEDSCSFLPGVQSVATTPQGDIIAAGNVCGSVDFGDGAISTFGKTASFIAKLRGADGSSKGSDGGWGKVLTSNWLAGPYVAADAAGNVLVTGSFQGTIDLGKGPLTSAGQNDVFLAKLANGGAVTWNKHFGDVSNQTVFDIAVDPIGGPIVVGLFQGSMQIEGETLTASADGSSFVFGYSTGGNLQWAKAYDGTEVRGVEVDASGSIFVAATLIGSADLGAGPLVSAGGQDVLIAKLAGDGSLLWNKRYGDAADQFPISLALTPAGEPILAGWASGTIDFGTGPLTSAGAVDVFVTKLSP